MTHDPVCQRSITLNLPNGLHLVPCSQIAQLVKQFDSEVSIRNGQKVANARTPLELMTLGADYGTELVLEAHGEDAEAVIDHLVQLFETNFHGSEDENDSATG